MMVDKNTCGNLFWHPRKNEVTVNNRGMNLELSLKTEAETMWLL